MDKSSPQTDLNMPDSRSDSNIERVDSFTKAEHDTSHIEGTIEGEERDGVVAISEAENKRLRRKIHARYVPSAMMPMSSSMSTCLSTEFYRSCVWPT